MKYRGQDYSQSQQQVPTIPSKEVLCYRGRKYYPREPVAINQPQTSDSQISAIILKYRRVFHVKEHHFPSKPQKTLVRY